MKVSAMADEPKSPTQTPNPDGKTNIAPLCDEASGGGGSAPDTRDRGMPGGSPADESDCDPISQPTSSGKSP